MTEVTTRNVAIEYYSRGLRQRFCLDALKLNPPKVDKDTIFAGIEYKIDEAKYHARSQARYLAGGLESEVPEDWPKTMKGPLVWSTADFQDETQYILQLGSADMKELEDALNHFKRSLLNHSYHS